MNTWMDARRGRSFTARQPTTGRDQPTTGRDQPSWSRDWGDATADQAGRESKVAGHKIIRVGPGCLTCIAGPQAVPGSG